MTHICRISSEFRWGPDTTYYQASCECGWTGHWEQGISTARDEWERHAF